MRKLRIIATASLLSIAMTSASLAGAWQPQTIVQWKYQNDDGSYATGWVEDDGKYYYLDADGILLTDTRTPDGYYVDADGVWDGKASATPVITAGGTVPAVGYTTSTPSTVYQPGIYQVGVDIPSGEYVLLALPDAAYTDYEVRTDSHFTSYDEGFVDGSEFRYNTIVLLKHGEFLSLNGCTASPISEVPRLDSSQAEMYKIGYHIPAGSYHLYALDYYYGGYAVLSSPTTTNLDDVISIDLIYGDGTVTVEDGQYLYLFECILAEETGSAALPDPSHSDKGTGNEAAQPTSKVVTAGITERLSSVTSTPSTVYPEGYYEVGATIPAGEYVVLSTSEWNSYYEIRTNADFESYENIVDSCYFTYNGIIRLEDGQFLSLRGCTASPIEEVPQISYIEGQMFKVGYHIPAGTYQIAVDEENDFYGSCYILSAPSDSYEVVLSSALIYYGESGVITVQDGQYVQLKGCHISG